MDENENAEAAIARLDERDRAKRKPLTVSRNTIWNLIWGGVGLPIVGGALIGVGFVADSDGVRYLCLVGGYILAGIGSCLMFVGLIAWGVLLGMRSHSEELSLEADVA